MKSIMYHIAVGIAFAAIALASTTATAQYTLNPSQPDADSPLEICIDLGATDNTQLKTILSTAPTTDIYLWTWITEGVGTPPNGVWGASLPDAKMTLKSGLVYCKTLGSTLADYYQVPSTALYGKRFNFLAKAQNGNLTSPEAKTEDIPHTGSAIKIFEPVLGPQLQGTHPVKWLNDTLLVTQSDVVTFKYNNSLDTLRSMHPSGDITQMLGADDVYVQVKGYITDQPTIAYSLSALQAIDITDVLKMTKVNANEFYYTFIPEKLLANAKVGGTGTSLPTGSTIYKMEFQIIRKRATPGSGPFWTPLLPKYSFFIANGL